MKDFRVSNDALDDVEELRQRVHDEGYLFFRSLIETGPIEELRRELLEVCQRGGWLKPGTDAADAVAHLDKASVFPEPDFMFVYNEMLKLESFNRFAHDPALLGLTSRLVGEPTMPHPRLIGRANFPKAGSKRYDITTPPHQDFVFIQGTEETYTAWVPIGDCPRELGGLAVLEGSGKGGVYAHPVADGTGGMGVDTSLLPGEWATADYRTGDVVFFHSLAVHKGLPNLTDRLRLSVDYRYSGVSQPKVAKELLAHGDQLSWEEIYSDWTSTDFQYYWKQYDINLVPIDGSFGARRDVEAFERAAQGDVTARAALVSIVVRDRDPVKRQAAEEALQKLDAIAAATSGRASS